MGLCDSQKQRKGDITYFCDRTERIFREDIKVSKLYIRKDFCPEPKKKFMICACTTFPTFKLIETERYMSFNMNCIAIFTILIKRFFLAI